MATNITVRLPWHMVGWEEVTRSLKLLVIWKEYSRYR